jgi:hypothetical protein
MTKKSAFRMLARSVVKFLLLFGVLLILIGPIARMNNEGFGDSPGPISVSDYWQRVSYILMPLGAVLAVGSGIILFILDTHRSVDVEMKGSLDTDVVVRTDVDRIE